MISQKMGFQQLIQREQPSSVQCESESEEACIIVRDLDEGVSSCIDPSSIPDCIFKSVSKSEQIWEEYWSQRQNLKQNLFRLVNQNKADELRLVLDRETVDLNSYQYLDGWSLMHHAVNARLMKIVLILISKGCSIDMRTHTMKMTPLHLAVLQKSEKIADILLNAGANPNIQDADFCTPTHYICEHGHFQLLKVFLSHENIDLKILNNKKMSPIDCCRDGKSKGLIREYCYKLGQQIRQKVYETRTIAVEKDVTLILRTRADYIDFVLGQTKNNENQDASHKNDQRKECKLKLGFHSKLGAKMHPHKLIKINEIAKKSLCSYNESLIECSSDCLQNYDLLRRLGQGNFGEVFLIRKKKSSTFLALKMLRKRDIFLKKLKNYVYAERQILKNIHHPFIAHASSFFQDEFHLFIVMEFCAGGDMERQVRARRFTELEAKYYCCEVALALGELHRNNYLFRDLKSANVLMTQLGHIKLTDFGLAKQSQISGSFLGSVAYLAPEMLVETASKPHTACIDWYLLGVFVFQMLTGLPPFYNENRLTMFEQIKNAKLRLPMNISKQCKSFLEGTLEKRPEKRLGFNGVKEIQSHPWFKQINWDQVLHQKLPMNAPQINQKQLRQRHHIEIQKNEEMDGNEASRNWIQNWDAQCL